MLTCSRARAITGGMAIEGFLSNSNISSKMVLKEYSVETIGARIEKFIDAAPFREKEISFDSVKREPHVAIPPIESDDEWLTWMYHNILKMKQVNENDEGLKYWRQELSRGKPRSEIEEFFRRVASKENQVSESSKGETLSKFLIASNASGVPILL